MTEIEDDALVVLNVLVAKQDAAERLGVDQIDEYVDAPDLQEATELSAPRLRHAVVLLETRSFVDVVRTMGSGALGFTAVRVTTPGRQSFLLSLEQAREEAAAPQTGEEAAAPETTRRRVFVVHGRDDSAREKVARTLEQLDLEPVILAEQASKGQTLIEKFEENAAGVVFAVAILTSDDCARGPDDGDWPDAPNRPRQNVVLELGYFMSALGRARVAALVQEGTERPSDIHGLVYIALDAESAWRFQLGRELRAAGVDVDLNRLA